MRYNYLDSVTEDVKEWIEENQSWFVENEYDINEDRDAIEEDLNDLLWMEDSITGNGSGSYTFNSYKAEEFLCHNLDLLGEALEAFGCSPDYMVKNGAEACDVTIRCYLLPQAIGEALDDLELAET